MLRQLRVTAGPQAGRRFPVSDEFTTMFGRSRHANTQLDDLAVSRVHCEVEIRNRRVLLTDLGSASGTFVNNQRVTECELKEGDILRIGNTQMRLEKQADETVETIPPADMPAPRPVLKTSEKLKGLTGTKLSHFTVGPVLAKGQSGLIFKATDFKNDRDVAMKVLWPEFTQNEDEMQRFIRAMKTMMPLRHPNLVALYGAGKTGPYCWIAMELVEGESLTQVISRIGAANMLDWKRSLRVANFLAKALEYAHGQNVIHRNITPQNVLIGKTPEETKLGDLMLAKAQEGSLAQQITKPGELLGDVRYMAPERTGNSSTEIDERSDLYSLGALLYALLTGRPPFQGHDLIDTLTKIRSAEPVRPRKFQMAIPESFETVVLKLLSKRPEDRYTTAASLMKEFERVARSNHLSLT